MHTYIHTSIKLLPTALSWVVRRRRCGGEGDDVRVIGSVIASPHGELAVGGLFRVWVTPACVYRT